jgi:sec-independent protein translocase protein TatC
MLNWLAARNEEGEEGEMSFLDHLEELRWHLIRSIVAILVFSVVAFFSKKFIFHDLILAPTRADFWTFRKLCELAGLLDQPFLCIEKLNFIIQNRSMTGQFSTHITVSFVVGLVVGFPYFFWEIWRFVKPGLYPRERKLTRGAVLYVSTLFFAGVLFGYYILSPLSINFLANYQVDESIENQVDLLSYIQILVMMVLACGIMFQLPMVIFVLAKGGIVSAKFLRTYRKHAIIIILFIAAILTPSPDVFSQLIVFAPIYLLYEISIFLAITVEKQKAEDERKGIT